MFEFFDQVLGYLEMLFTFISNTVQSLFLTLTFLVSSMSFPQMLVGYMAPIIGTSITIFLAIYLIKFIIGR